MKLEYLASPYTHYPNGINAAFRDVCKIAARLIREVAECKHPEARHALEMIADKMARLIETPDHLDSAMDLAGYARTLVMVTDRD